MRYLRICLSVSLLMLAAPALAQVLFERTDIQINPAPLGGRNGEVTLQRPPVKLNIELRGQDALQLEYIHTLNTLSNDTGVMVVLNEPAVVPLPAWQVYTPLDALFVSGTGEIVQIVPNVNLGNMQQDIESKTPIKAFLLLRAGQVKADLIRPHDVVVDDSIFDPGPAVMQ